MSDHKSTMSLPAGYRLHSEIHSTPLQDFLETLDAETVDKMARAAQCELYEAPSLNSLLLRDELCAACHGRGITR